MKVLLWIGDSEQHKALVGKINERFSLVGVIVEKRVVVRELTFKFLIHKLIEKILFPQINNAWQSLKEHFKKAFPAFPQVKTHLTSNINDYECYQFSTECNPDVILVSGTSLIRHQMLSIKPRLGILNLHTGLSPYIKGGPNCTNWCISKSEIHLIGNTIMFIDAGIDSGDVLFSRQVEFIGNESLKQIHLKVMEDAHALSLESLRFLNENGVSKGVKQYLIAMGHTYYSKNWGLSQKKHLHKNMKRFNILVNSEENKKKKSAVITVAQANLNTPDIKNCSTQ